LVECAPSEDTVFNPFSSESYGALAQLGERNTGSVEVSGSIPLGSTNKNSLNINSLKRIRDHPSGGFFMPETKVGDNLGDI
jgi:hypothetical protein